MKEQNNHNSVDEFIQTFEQKTDKDLEKYFNLKNEQFNLISIQKFQVKNQKTKSRNLNSNNNPMI